MRNVYVVVDYDEINDVPGSPLMAFEAYEDAWMLASKVGDDPGKLIASVLFADASAVRHARGEKR